MNIENFAEIEEKNFINCIERGVFYYYQNNNITKKILINSFKKFYFFIKNKDNFIKYYDHQNYYDQIISLRNLIENINKLANETNKISGFETIHIYILASKDIIYNYYKDIKSINGTNEGNRKQYERALNININDIRKNGNFDDELDFCKSLYDYMINENKQIKIHFQSKIEYDKIKKIVNDYISCGRIKGAIWQCHKAYDYMIIINTALALQELK